MLRAEDFSRISKPVREDLRKRIVLWARIVAARLRAYGLELSVRGVDDGGGPCALFLTRGAGVRESRAALVLGVDTEHVRAGLELPSVQAHSVRARLSNPARALEFSAALEALPEQFVVRVDGDSESIQAPRCGVDELRPLLDRSAQEGRPLWIGWCVPRDVAVEHAALLDEQLEDALAALATVYLLLTGDVDSGAAVSRSKRSGERAKRSARGLADDERERGSEGAPSDPQNRRANARPRDARREREADADSQPEVEHAEDAPPPPGRADPRGPPRAAFRRRSLGAGGKSDPAPPIERGARVRVLEGAFAGKVGVVHELDGKGGARVMLGLLAVRLDVKNLTAQIEGRHRPVLSTSHRKPMPVRS